MDSTAERIAVEALRLLEAEGPTGVSMRRVAKVVGITPMAIYHHFADRGTLLRFVVDREFLGFQESLREMEAREESHEAALLRYFDAYVDYAFERPMIFDYVFLQVREDARRYPEDFEAGRSPSLNVIAERVEAAMADGFLKAGNLWETVLVIWAHVHGLVALYRGGRIALDRVAFKDLVHRSIGGLLHGLAN